MAEYAGLLVRINADQPLKDVYKNFVEAVEMSSWLKNFCKILWLKVRYNRRL